MCGRFTVKATRAEFVAMYRQTMDAPPHNLRSGNTKGSWEASHQEPFARGSLPDGLYEFGS